MENARKMTFMDAFLMASGVIIGAGIFAMTGIGVKAAGPAVPLAFLLGGLYAIFDMIPILVVSSAIPVKGGNYRYVSEFIGPLAGFLVFWHSILGIATLTMMGIAAGQYLPILLPFLSQKMASAIVVIAISAACFYNISVSAKVQNIMVLLIFVALGLFVFMAIPHMKHWSLTGMLKPKGIAGLLLGINYLRYAALGATTLVPLGDEIENPGKNIPAAAFSSTIGISIVYAVVAMTAVAVIPWEQMVDQTLGTAAQSFMPPWALTFFLIGGALFAVATTFLGSMLMTSRMLWAAAEDGLLPKWFSAVNKHGIPHNILALLTIGSLIPILAGASIEYAYALQMAPQSIVTALIVSSAIIAPLKRPEPFETAWFKIPAAARWILAVTNIVMALYFGYQLLMTLDKATIIGVFAFFGIGIVYYYWWKGRLASQNIDLEASMGIRFD